MPDLGLEHEELEALIEHPGWKRVVARASDVWTGPDAFKRNVSRAVISTPHSPDADKMARYTVLQIQAVTDAIEDLLRYPQARLRAIAHATQEGQRRESDPFRQQRRIP